jgi:hypothetical protein
MIALLMVPLALWGAPVAAADPDPHIPDFTHGVCPGQRPGVWVWTGNCDGVPYRDGSFWRAFGVGFTVMSVTCMGPGGGGPAPMGGCEGRPVPDVTGLPLSTP